MPSGCFHRRHLRIEIDSDQSHIPYANFRLVGSHAIYSFVSANNTGKAKLWLWITKAQTRIRYAILDASKKTRIRVSRAFILRLRCSLISERHCTIILVQPGLEIATNTVAFATKFFPLRLKYLEKSQICDLLSPSLFRNKRVSSCHFAATFAKINKWQNYFVSHCEFSLKIA